MEFSPEFTFVAPNAVHDPRHVPEMLFKLSLKDLKEAMISQNSNFIFTNDLTSELGPENMLVSSKVLGQP